MTDIKTERSYRYSRLTFSSRLHEIRKDRRLTQRELGLRAKVAYNTIYNWETGATVPTRNSKPLERVAKALEVQISELLDYDPNQIRKSSDETNRIINEIASLCAGGSNIRLTREDATQLLFTTQSILNKYISDQYSLDR